MDKRLGFGVLGFVALSILISPALVSAHCPLCTAAVGSGLVVARSMGIDDSVVGIWVGALIISSALWLNKFLVKRKKCFRFQKGIIVAAFFLLTIIPFYFSNLINFQYTFLGIDRLLLGTVAGCFITMLGFWTSGKIRSMNGKAVIPFQAIVVTVGILILSNLAIILVA